MNSSQRSPSPPALRLERGGTMPLHAKAEKLLRRLMAQPAYGAGALLPDEVSLARTLGISRNTLRVAIGRLVQEGRLERKSGVGTRVVEPRVQSGIGSWHSFTREMAAKGVTAETYSTKIATLPATGAAAQALQIPAETPVLCVERVRGWDGRAEVHFQSWLHPRLKLTEGDDFTLPLYQMIQERCSVVADESQEELQAVKADRRLARLLAIPVGTALLRRVRTVLDTGRRPIEFAIVHYRCERFTLTLNLRKE